MGIQTKEALIAEIERFKTESLKTHIVKVWAESYANTNPFDYVILEKENNKVWWMKTQAYQLWQMWQAAKAKVVPEGFGDIQSWIAVNSFSALDAVHENMPIIDANELAKYIDSLNIDMVVPEGFVLVPKEPNDKITFSVLDDIFSCSFCYDDPSSWKMAYKKLINGVSKTVIEAQEQKG